jgi:hypothetical protein
MINIFQTLTQGSDDRCFGMYFDGIQYLSFLGKL